MLQCCLCTHPATYTTTKHGITRAICRRHLLYLQSLGIVRDGFTPLAPAPSRTGRLWYN